MQLAKWAICANMQNNFGLNISSKLYALEGAWIQGESDAQREFERECPGVLPRRAVVFNTKLHK